MAAKSRTADPESIDPEVKKLQGTIEWMDCLSQGGFSEIASIAKLAIASMDAHVGAREDDIYYALKAIWGKADDIQDCINREAEQVGCAHRSERTLQYLAAASKQRDANRKASEREGETA